MNTNLIHKWLLDPKFAPDLRAVEEQTAAEPCFLPVEIADRPVTEEPAPAPTAYAASCHSASEINVAGSHQLRIVGSYDLETLARLIRALSA